MYAWPISVLILAHLTLVPKVHDGAENRHGEELEGRGEDIDG